MATVLDIGLVQYFDVIFSVLLIWSFVFAILSKTRAVSDSVGINATIAVAASFLALVSKSLISIISFMVPWFAVAIIFLVLLLLLFQIFGVTDFKSAASDKTVYWSLIGVGLLILGAAFSQTFGQQLTEAAFEGGQAAEGTAAEGQSGVASANFQQNIYATLFHPKVLGMIVLFVIAIFAVVLLSGAA